MIKSYLDVVWFLKRLDLIWCLYERQSALIEKIMERDQCCSVYHGQCGCVGETFRLACDSDFPSPKGAQISFHILYRLNMSCALGCGSITVPQGQDERVTILTPWQSHTFIDTWEKYVRFHLHLAVWQFPETMEVSAHVKCLNTGE